MCTNRGCDWNWNRETIHMVLSCVIPSDGAWDRLWWQNCLLGDRPVHHQASDLRRAPTQGQVKHQRKIYRHWFHVTGDAGDLLYNSFFYIAAYGHCLDKVSNVTQRPAVGGLRSPSVASSDAGSSCGNTKTVIIHTSDMQIPQHLPCEPGYGYRHCDRTGDSSMRFPMQSIRISTRKHKISFDTFRVDIRNVERDAVYPYETEITDL